MNKTVNINLAGISYHIDEDAFGKLSRYLEAIKKSLVGTEGNEEIMRDIEARMAELFSEKLENNAQVITIKELDEIINVMGQPEDYQVDDDIFEDTPPNSQQETKWRSSSKKQLFRDIDDKYIGGVSSGLGHYLGIDSIWIRLVWILLVFAGMGSPILIYILLWIFVPAAETTSEKLKMTGEPINISNIEKKFKEGFDNVADKVKNADYGKFEKQIKSGTSNFFDALGNLIVGIFKIIGKLIGIFIIIISLITLIGLIVFCITFGSFGFWGNGEVTEWIAMVDTTQAPLWVLLLTVFFAVGIPFFALFILGLKLLISNLKTMGSKAKITLLALWVLSIIALGILGIKQATQQAYDGQSITEAPLAIKSNDTLKITMVGSKDFGFDIRKNNDREIKYNSKKEKVIYSNDIRVILRSTKDSIGKIVIEKGANGSDYLKAQETAEAIEYNYVFENNELKLNGYFTTNLKNKFRDQDIEIAVYLPVGTIIYADENTYSYHQNNQYYDDIFKDGEEEKHIRILTNSTECLDCPDEISVKQTEYENDGSWEREVNSDFNESPVDSVQTGIKDSII